MCACSSPASRGGDARMRVSAGATRVGSEGPWMSASSSPTRARARCERVREMHRDRRFADAALAGGHRDTRADVLEPRRLPRIDASRGRGGAEVDRERALQRLGKLAREMGGTHVGQLATLRMRRSREREHDVQPFPATLRFVDARYAARDDGRGPGVDRKRRSARAAPDRARPHSRDSTRWGAPRRGTASAEPARSTKHAGAAVSAVRARRAVLCASRHARRQAFLAPWLEPVRTFPHNEWVII